MKSTAKTLLANGILALGLSFGAVSSFAADHGGFGDSYFSGSAAAGFQDPGPSAEELSTIEPAAGDAQDADMGAVSVGKDVSAQTTLSPDKAEAAVNVDNGEGVIDAVPANIQ